MLLEAAHRVIEIHAAMQDGEQRTATHSSDYGCDLNMTMDVNGDSKDVTTTGTELLHVVVPNSILCDELPSDAVILATVLNPTQIQTELIDGQPMVASGTAAQLVEHLVADAQARVTVQSAMIVSGGHQVQLQLAVERANRNMFRTLGIDGARNPSFTDTFLLTYRIYMVE